MACNTASWFYGVISQGITGTKYGTLTRITTPSSLPSLNCTVAYWVSCRSTNLDEQGNHRFYQATIAYTPSVGHWAFSWGYSAYHLAQPPFTGLTPTANHTYELGIRFTGSNVEVYVIDVATSIKYAMGTLSDNGTMWTAGDNPGFIMEGFSSQISDINVAAFEAYSFSVFLSPTTSTQWPHAVSYLPPNYPSIPAQIHTYSLGNNQFLIGQTTQGSQLPDNTTLW